MSFRSLKKQWLRANNNDAAAKALINSRNHRRTQRRGHKSDHHLHKVVEPYAAEYGLDPVVLKDMIHHEYLSDEVSGPEEETGESFEVWRVRMAALADLSVAPASLERLQILEVLVPEWRTDPQKQNISYDRVSTNRSLPRIPMYAPYNFGFSEDWLKRNRKDREKRELLADWGKTLIHPLLPHSSFRRRRANRGTMKTLGQAGVVQALGRVKTVLSARLIRGHKQTNPYHGIMQHFHFYLSSLAPTVYSLCSGPEALTYTTIAQSFWIGLTIFALGWWTRRKGCMQGYRILYSGLESATVSHVPTTPSLHTVSPPRWPFKIAVFHPVPVCFRPHPSVFADKCSSRYYSTSIIVNVAMVVTNVSKLSSGPAELWQQVIHSFPSLHFLSRCPLAAAMFRCRGHAATSLYRSCSGRGQ
ncbi:hypothetical protein B0H13DRAFT_2289196 [Mycena leptocephala]|nr:hypothetical protein B0H13DRAFT_2289196 [Mycena leptocephala]